MKDLKGSKTEKNLAKAFAGESQARNKYTYFASVAKKEGYEEIAQIFLDTADNEKEHAKLHFRALAGIGDTVANLKAAAGGEDEEALSMYPQMAQEAREEGFADLAMTFERIGQIEAHHRDRYKAILASVETGRVFKKEQKVRWRCRNCGYIHEGPSAPSQCPVCKHPQAYFEVVADNF